MAYFHISSGKSGAAAANAKYITRRQAVRGGLDGVATINAPGELQGSTDYREFQTSFQAFARATQRAEIAGHGNRRGSARTHYRTRFAIPQGMERSDALAKVASFMHERFPSARTVLTYHEDADSNHVHGWTSARLAGGNGKLHISRSDFKKMTREWGDLSAKLDAEVDAGKHQFTNHQRQLAESGLAHVHRQKVSETETYKKDYGQYAEAVKNGTIEEKMDAFFSPAIVRPERIEGVGAVPFSARDYQQALYDKQDMKAEGPRQEELNRLFRARAEARHAWREEQRQEQEKQNQIIEQARQIIEQAKGWFSVEGGFEDAGLTLGRHKGRVVVEDADERIVALAETGKTFEDLETEFGAVSAHTDQRDRWQEAATSQEKALMDEKAPGFEPEYSLPAKVNGAPKPKRERDRKRGKSLSRSHRGRNGGMEL